MSLDGVVEAPGGEPTHPHAGWTTAYADPAGFAYKLQETMDAESMLLGRVTYQGFAAAWPKMADVDR
jgi:dihydrofolate reductase